MNYYNYIYEPEEDSFMLLDCSIKETKHLTQKKQIKICEVGVGSGYTLTNLAKTYTNPNIQYFGTDINPKAIEYTKNKQKRQFEAQIRTKITLDSLYL